MRVSGEQAGAIVRRLFRSRKALEPRVATYGDVVDERGEPIDRGLALLFPAPHSYTGESMAELHIHGSPAVAREVLRAMLACGARYAQAGEFTRRAFLNGKLDLAAAEAVADLIDAETRSAARAALANLSGGLAGAVRNIRARLSALLEELAAAVDFPDEVQEPSRGRLREGLESMRTELAALLRDAEVGRLVREGIGVAIVGPPNAGKSSLLNALLGEERALVSEIPGTTRDTIEEAITVDGVRVRLTDTAGLREAPGRLEAAGVERARSVLAGSRLALVVIDASQPLSAEARAVLAATRGRERVVFFNKADAGDAGFRARDDAERDAILGSTRRHDSLERVRRAIAAAAWGARTPDLERPHLASLREIDAVAAARASLAEASSTVEIGLPVDVIVPDLQRAFASLGHLTGDEAGEALIAGIFARFCIGK